MSICQVMIGDFLGSYPSEECKDGYDRYDLLVGLDYTEALLAEGETIESFHHYDLAQFAQWCRERLKECPE